MRPVVEAWRISPRPRTTHTELHWVRGSSKSDVRTRGHEWGVADRTLGELNWVEVDPARVRSSVGVRHRFTPAMYYWQRTRSHVWCESQEERRELLWLDYGGQVERLWSQPFAISWGRRSRLAGLSHFPDFLGQFIDGTYGLFDVRPKARIDERAKLQFAETAAMCELMGLRYQVLSGHDGRATGNLECLSASRHDRCRPSPGVESGILEAAAAGQSRRALCDLVSPGCPPLACEWVDNMAWRRLLDVDLGAVFSSDTVYTTSASALTSMAH
ncbi:TnsA-like heteromeric transposase endonuclease subunit [Microbacterium sp. NPDC087591]|uniref:TnsA-like heteromeric transposase endonuclease subunit n=1 Tax=Microbacterium sp. NPDC087591 TaxID=3364192 RepID=UPI00381CC7C3